MRRTDDVDNGGARLPGEPPARDAYVIMSTLRLFTAVFLPADVARAVDRALAPLRDAIDARWVPRDKLHITLRFFGAVDAGRVDAMKAALLHTASDFGPFTLRVRGAGAFPAPSRARVLWVGVDDDNGALAALASAVERTAVQLGFSPEKRAFRPHVTVARARRRPIRLPPSFIRETTIDSPPFSVDHFDLVRSNLDRAGARYTAVARFSLPGASTS